MNIIERYLDYWYWTGSRADNQFQFYRCELCKGIVTWKHIKQDGGCPCGASRVSPTKPRFTEKCRILLMPWTI